MQNPTALIIGAGVGGIAAAAHLAHNGYRVRVIEKNLQPGGRCGQLVRDGHRFDTGPTLFLMPQVFAHTYAALGESMQDHLTLRRIEPTYRLHFHDDTHLDLSADLHAMQAQLETIEPGSFGRFLRYLGQGHQAYHLVLQHLVGRNFYNLAQYLSPANIRLLIKLKSLRNHYDDVGRFFQHANLKAGFTFQDMYLGMSPCDAPATYALVQYSELAHGVWFPAGGLYSVVKSLLKIAEARGVQLTYGAQAQQIEVDADRATGVVLRDGSHVSADVIVANADLPYVYDCLLPDRRPVKRLEKLEYSCSAFMFYWGTNKVYPQLGPHNVFVARDYCGSFDRIFRDKSLPDEPSFYVHAPARVDPTAAPPGQDTLMVLVPVGHLNGAEPQDLLALQSQARSAVLQRLARIGVSHIAGSIKFEMSITPRLWLSQYNIAKGAAFGSLSHNFRQVGYLRPQNRHARYRNLYFVGGSTHPGNGLPLVLLSARLATERILHEIGHRRPVRTRSFAPSQVAWKA